MLLGLDGTGLAAPGSAPDQTMPETTPTQAMPAQTMKVPDSQAEISLGFVPVVRQAAPAVVSIYTRTVVERRASPFAGDPFFERLFGDLFSGGPTRRRIENSLGSGVIVDASGIVVSNYHVVDGADQITVVLTDRREFEGRVILADKEADLAIVELEGASGLPVLELRDSDTLEVGELVLAIGNPFGVVRAVTSGTVPGRGRPGPRGGLGGRTAGVDDVRPEPGEICRSRENAAHADDRDRRSPPTLYGGVIHDGRPNRAAARGTRSPATGRRSIRILATEPRSRRAARACGRRRSACASRPLARAGQLRHPRRETRRDTDGIRR